MLTWSLNEVIFIAPFGSLFRASGSTLAWKNVFQSVSKFKICYPRSSKKARWADSPLKARVCSRLKPRMAWLFTFQNSSFSVFHQTISQSAAVLLTTCAAVPCISCQCSPLPLQLKNRFSSENLPKRRGFSPQT